MKPVIYSAHALERMRERNVSHFQIESAVRNPDWEGIARRGRIHAKKRFEKQYLNVFYKETKNIIVLATAYWSRR